MTERQSATYERWLDTYMKLYDALPDDALPDDAQVPCPNCGQRRLRLVFTGRGDVGYASMWCDACLWGIAVSRVSIPAGGTVLDRDLTDAERRRTVPNFRIVQPGDDDDDFELAFPDT
jgi:hypothetical protein